MKRKKGISYLIFLIVNFLYVSSFCALQESQVKDDFIDSTTEWTAGDMEKILSRLYKAEVFSEELYEDAEGLLKTIFQNTLEELSERGEVIRPEDMDYYTSQFRVFRETRNKKRKEHQKIIEEHQKILKQQCDYCQNKLLLQAVPRMIYELCSEKKDVSLVDLARAYSVVSFIIARETIEENKVVLKKYKRIQEQLQDKAKALSTANLSDKSSAQDFTKESNRIYADYFFKKIVEAVDAFCSWDSLYYSDIVHQAVTELVILIGEVINHEKSTEEVEGSTQRILCYGLLQDRIFKKCTEIEQRNYEEKVKEIIAGTTRKQASVLKSKKRYRDKRKKKGKR